MERKDGDPESVGSRVVLRVDARHHQGCCRHQAAELPEAEKGPEERCLAVMPGEKTGEETDQHHPDGDHVDAKEDRAPGAGQGVAQVADPVGGRTEGSGIVGVSHYRQRDTDDDCRKSGERCEWGSSVGRPFAPCQCALMPAPRIAGPTLLARGEPGMANRPLRFVDPRRTQGRPRPHC